MHAAELTRSLPSAEEILRAVGLQRARGGAGDLLGGAAVFGAGILVGAGLALLFAPSSGAEVREQLGSRIDEVRERVGHAVSEAPKSDGPKVAARAATSG